MKITTIIKAAMPWKARDTGGGNYPKDKGKPYGQHSKGR